MAEIKTGGPAFPTGDMVERDEKGLLHGYPISSAGMTLRDYFAAKALDGDLASQSETVGMFENNTPDSFLVDRAKFYYRFADAMITAREGSSS
ncbi:hypothetical protein [Ochrobactrum sp. EDr1-4]|uniref:hypothetical protein n=1 Tax=Ochrobactrum sp. EDr1-4 TaxID=3368622 RepID=UPI003BA1EA04